MAQKVSQKKKTPQLPPGHLMPISPRNRPFQKVSVDLLGRFPISHYKKRWIIVCTDYLSSTTFRFELKTCEAVLRPLPSYKEIIGVTYEVEPLGEKGRRRKINDIAHLLRMKPFHGPSGQEDQDIGVIESILRAGNTGACYIELPMRETGRLKMHTNYLQCLTLKHAEP
ncbi:hypothetical protein LAZ67_8001572 [Cordylochernes scorpioides]|uniref:Uncharacterized protein n=1 Tax=Cordylochernes scorpioides TaxID=51811 RepID=A0ABY6KRX4_9ARAC|nr:hypothetical protein LAZ67_8001572 [Cordylochernes scorpioides]